MSLRREIGTLAVCISLGAIATASAADFPGWQGMRVIKQEGEPYLMRKADLDGDGREELIVVNSRLSRLEVYRWLPDRKSTRLNSSHYS